MSEKLKGGYFKDLTVDEEITLNLKVKEIGKDYGLDELGSEYGPAARCCERTLNFIFQ